MAFSLDRESHGVPIMFAQKFTQPSFQSIHWRHREGRRFSESMARFKKKRGEDSDDLHEPL